MLLELNVQDGIHEKEVAQHIQKTRAELLSRFAYNRTQQYGMSNDDIGRATSDEPLPYLPATQQTDDGYVGLDPPIGG